MCVKPWIGVTITVFCIFNLTFLHFLFFFLSFCLWESRSCAINFSWDPGIVWTMKNPPQRTLFFGWVKAKWLILFIVLGIALHCNNTAWSFSSTYELISKLFKYLSFHKIYPKLKLPERAPLTTTQHVNTDRPCHCQQSGLLFTLPGQKW